MKDTLKLGGILFLITAICAGLLGLVNAVTLPIINEKKEVAKQEAMKILLKEATMFKQIEGVSEEGIEELYIAKKENEYLGAIAKVEPEGYGGEIEMLIGVDKENKVTGIQILTHAETPGLGANILQDAFKNQFTGKIAPMEVVKGTPNEGEISAITGATITSKAVVQGVNQAVSYISENRDQLIGEVK